MVTFAFASTQRPAGGQKVYHSGYHVQVALPLSRWGHRFQDQGFFRVGMTSSPHSCQRCAMFGQFVAVFQLYPLSRDSGRHGESLRRCCTCCRCRCHRYCLYRFLSRCERKGHPRSRRPAVYADYERVADCCSCCYYVSGSFYSYGGLEEATSRGNDVS